MGYVGGRGVIEGGGQTYKKRVPRVPRNAILFEIFRQICLCFYQVWTFACANHKHHVNYYVHNM